MRSYDVELLQKVLTFNMTQADLADAVVDLSQGDLLKAGIGALETATGIAEMFAKLWPGIGPGLATTSLAANVSSAVLQYQGEING